MGREVAGEKIRLRFAEGHTNQAIAEQLDLSVKTIESYRARLLRKLRLRSRADIIRYAVETGLLAPRRPSDLPGDGT